MINKPIKKPLSLNMLIEAATRPPRTHPHLKFPPTTPTELLTAVRTSGAAGVWRTFVTNLVSTRTRIILPLKTAEARCAPHFVSLLYGRPCRFPLQPSLLKPPVIGVTLSHSPPTLYRIPHSFSLSLFLSLSIFSRAPVALFADWNTNYPVAWRITNKVDNGN